MTIRKCIIQYYFDIYNLGKLAENNVLKNIEINESLFAHENDGIQDWVIGMINI